MFLEPVPGQLPMRQKANISDTNIETIFLKKIIALNITCRYSNFNKKPPSQLKSAEKPLMFL